MFQRGIPIFSAFGTAANGSNIDERTAQKLLAEEEAAMEKFRF